MDSLLSKPEVLTALAAIIGVIATGIAGVVSGIWAVKKWKAERQDARDQENKLESARLEQQQLEERNRRAGHASQLIQNFGSAQNDDGRTWAAMALALYPDETLPLLINLLGKFDEMTTTSIELALVSMGTKAIPEITKINRIAKVMCEYQIKASTEGTTDNSTAPPMEVQSTLETLKHTRRILNQIILNSDLNELGAIDLEDVDLTGANFFSAKLPGIQFRKALLDNSILSHASVKGASFRGAKIEGTTFTRSAANGADFTGATGAAHMIGLYAQGSKFDYADLRGAVLDGADLTDCSMQNTKLDKATLNGAQLTGSTLNRTKLQGVRAKGLIMINCQLYGVYLSRSNLEEGKLGKTKFEQCRLNACQMKAVQAPAVLFVNCNLGGSDMSFSNLSDITFHSCNLGGVSFENAMLTNSKFINCNLSSSSFKNTKLSGAHFQGRNEARNILDATGSTWNQATFDQQSTDLQNLFSKYGI